MADANKKTDTQLDSEHFSPYRTDGKLVRRILFPFDKWREKEKDQERNYQDHFTEALKFIN
jgi:hypothetical protein